MTYMDFLTNTVDRLIFIYKLYFSEGKGFNLKLVNIDSLQKKVSFLEEENVHLKVEVRPKFWSHILSNDKILNYALGK